MQNTGYVIKNHELINICPECGGDFGEPLIEISSMFVTCKKCDVEFSRYTIYDGCILYKVIDNKEDLP